MKKYGASFLFFFIGLSFIGLNIWILTFTIAKEENSLFNYLFIIWLTVVFGGQGILAIVGSIVFLFNKKNPQVKALIDLIENLGDKAQKFMLIFPVFCFLIWFLIDTYTYFFISSAKSYINNPNNYFLGIGGILIGVILTKWLYTIQKSSCYICHLKPAYKLWSNQSFHSFCKIHLFEEFSREFKSYANKMVVFKPKEPEAGCELIYHFLPLNKVNNRRVQTMQTDFKEDDRKKIQSLLNAVGGLCELCWKNSASIAYANEGGESNNNNVISLHYSLEKKVSTQNLCSSCAVSKILPLLQKYEKIFKTHGLDMPHDGEGIYIMLCL